MDTMLYIILFVLLIIIIIIGIANIVLMRKRDNSQTSDTESLLYGNYMASDTMLLEISRKLESLNIITDNLATTREGVQELQTVLTNNQARGIFGEQELNYILAMVFGNDSQIYKTQVSFTGKEGQKVRADAVVKMPKPIGMICVDSKFPLNNYRKMYETGISRQQQKTYSKKFKQDVKTHISKIADNYIVPRKTADSAIMFIPAESVFSELYSHHLDVIEFAYRKKIWIASPTTLIAILTIVARIVADIKQDERAIEIKEELIDLEQEFDRYAKRWANVEKDAQKLTSDLSDVAITSRKISTKFNKMRCADLSNTEKPIE